RSLVVAGDRVWLGQGPRENSARPAIGPRMRSVAVCCGPRSVGVVLTGTLSDGASGLRAIGQTGGITVVQDPSDAAFPDMPLNALTRLLPYHVVTLAAMPRVLNSLVLQPAGEAVPVPGNPRIRAAIAPGARSRNGDR